MSQLYRRKNIKGFLRKSRRAVLDSILFYFKLRDNNYCAFTSKNCFKLLILTKLDAVKCSHPISFSFLFASPFLLPEVGVLQQVL